MWSRVGCSWIAVAALLTAATSSAGQTLTVSSNDGRRTLTAVRATTPVTVDGVLDDAVWQSAPAADAFVQSDPREGFPASPA